MHGKIRWRTDQTLDSSGLNARPPGGYPSHQLLGRHGQDKLEVQLVAADKPALAQATVSLGSAEALLEPLAETLAHGITWMVVGSSTDRR